ncbi:hypothetical protein C8Q76DRAFT_134167 [Earliella scabrosa]|nr:hypothetical protein C8Q76DRAFT_134167 [Earliella scabrosa]
MGSDPPPCHRSPDEVLTGPHPSMATSWPAMPPPPGRSKLMHPRRRTSARRVSSTRPRPWNLFCTQTSPRSGVPKPAQGRARNASARVRPPSTRPSAAKSGHKRPSPSIEALSGSPRTLISVPCDRCLSCECMRAYCVAGYTFCSYPVDTIPGTFAVLGNTMRHGARHRLLNFRGRRTCSSFAVGTQHADTSLTCTAYSL